jgi:hypothetical protein
MNFGGKDLSISNKIDLRGTIGFFMGLAINVKHEITCNKRKKTLKEQLHGRLITLKFDK